jgi:DNA-binding transcriptional LysR family regulator
MHYTLHQLQVFAKVVQLKSMTRASEDLHMTQPAVSIQLKNFQNQFDIPLTEVIGRQLYITDFGMEIYKMAEKIINEVYSINYKTMSYRGELTGRLQISTVSGGTYIMPHFLSGFLNKNKGVDLVMDVTNKSKVINNLKNNEIDFALVSSTLEGLNVNEELLMDNELYMITNRKGKISKTPTTRSEINKMQLILREEGSGTRYVIENYSKKHNMNLNEKMVLTSNEAVKQAVIAGLGNSILPLIGIKNELLNGDLKIITATGFPIKSKWRLIWLKEKKKSPVAEAYIKYVSENKETILKDQFNWVEKFNHKK